MLSLKTKKARQAILNEIVATLEFIDYLKYETMIPVTDKLNMEIKRKEELIAKFRAIELN